MEIDDVEMFVENAVAAARREGVIEGLERALSHASDPGLSNWAIKRLIKVDVERLRAARSGARGG